MSDRRRIRTTTLNQRKLMDSRQRLERGRSHSLPEMTRRNPSSSQLSTFTHPIVTSGNERRFKIQGWSRSSSLDDEGMKQLRSAFFTLSNYRKYQKKSLEGALVDAKGNRKETVRALGAYRQHIKGATVTPRRMIEYLNQQEKEESLTRWSGRFDEESRSTVLIRGKQEMGRFLHGESAFIRKKRQRKGVEREVYVKRWDGLTGKKKPKEFIRDDYGNFTRRYAYRIDTTDFLKQLRSGGLVGKGRHFRERSTTEPGTAPEFNQLSVSEMELLGKISGTHGEGLRRFNELYSNTPLKKRGPLDKITGNQQREAFGRTLLSDQHRTSDEMGLFLHQFWGNQNSQRGFALTSTGRGIVGNYGEGFGYQRDQRERRKIKIDLARVPKRKKDEAPMLFNYDSSVMGAKRLTVPTRLTLPFRGSSRTIDYPQQQFESSTSKNRELFLRTLTRKMVVDWNVPMKKLDTLPGIKQGE